MPWGASSAGETRERPSLGPRSAPRPTRASTASQRSLVRAADAVRARTGRARRDREAAAPPGPGVATEAAPHPRAWLRAAPRRPPLRTCLPRGQPGRGRPTGVPAPRGAAGEDASAGAARTRSSAGAGDAPSRGRPRLGTARRPPRGSPRPRCESGARRSSPRDGRGLFPAFRRRRGRASTRGEAGSGPRGRGSDPVGPDERLWGPRPARAPR